MGPHLYCVLYANTEGRSEATRDSRNSKTHALPMTPHASFAIAPFSLSREKNPGLDTENGFKYGDGNGDGNADGGSE